jgi:hypothetical protein
MIEDDAVTTEISVVGANCPWCFNETVELLRGEPGVVSVSASIADSCMRIDHRGVATERLLGVVRGHLHADDATSAEHLMVAVDPRVAELHCAHHRRDQGSARDV